MFKIKMNLENLFYSFLLCVLGYNSYLILEKGFENRKIDAFIDSHHDHYLYDLKNIKTALDKYYADHQSYPKNESFDGIKSCWGKSIKNWIPELTPKYIDKLPDISKENPDCGHQYLYKSNGKGFKLIVHFPEDCEDIKSNFPSLIDPSRNCFAYGFWNEDGKNL